MLSLDTGHERDYSEGAAYRDYFATDELMFAVPEARPASGEQGRGAGPAVRARTPTSRWRSRRRYLDKHPLHHDRVGEVSLVVLTDRSGANRVYETRGRRFDAWDRDRALVDAAGVAWTLREDRLESSAGDVLERLPAHRAFWFGWYSAYPDTRLVK